MTLHWLKQTTGRALRCGHSPDQVRRPRDRPRKGMMIPLLPKILSVVVLVVVVTVVVFVDG